MIKGFLFDLDGVITDSAEYHYQAWKQLAARLNIVIDRKFNEKLKGVSRMDSLELILKHADTEHNYSSDEKNAFATEKNNIYLGLIKQITPKDILPGIDKLLIQIKSHHMKLGLASASKNGPEILKRLEIFELFDVIVDPSMLKNGKPDPEIFLTGAELLGLSVEECIGIEDAQAGIKSINSAGMFSVGVGDPISMKEAKYRVNNTKELDFNELIKVSEK